MRTSTALVAVLPALAAAQQIPLMDQLNGYINQAKAFIGQNVASVPSDPVAAAAGKVAEKNVSPLTVENWEQVLSATPGATASVQGPEEWLVYITGGNKTCYGLCGNATKAFSESVAVLSAEPNAPHFAKLDCEDQGVLCSAWAVNPPALYHMLLPVPLADQTKPATTVRYIPLNRSSSTTELVKNITVLHTTKEYEKIPPYEGFLHPFDGQLHKLGADIPYGYVMWGFSKMPSWLPMIAVSFLSRSFMGRMQPRPAQGGAQGGAAPAPAR